ncbi:MAG: hypothetical protein RIQ93_2556 [Verrucomicrobiota bacterium]|jgi:chemotaxis methyl-accepting protein methylase
MLLTHIAFHGTAARTPAFSSQSVGGVRPLGRLPPKSFEPPEPLHPFAAHVLTRAGIEPTAYRAKPLHRRLSACLRQSGAPSLPVAQQLLERSPKLLHSALDTLLIGVSAFFRDAPVFQALRSNFLPELLRRQPSLNVFSAGSSGGHELYSMAMLLDELSALENSTFLGVDCRAQAIAQAQSGRFESAEVAGLSAAQQEKYFTCRGGLAVVRESLRSRLEWRCLDLLSFAGGSGAKDVILFRNVAIYLEPTAAAQAYERFTAQLSPGGLLVTGKAESPPKSLPLTRVAPSIFRKL